MSIEDLKEQNILLPEKEWGIHKLKTTVQEIPVLISFICCIAALFMTYFGNGNIWTWIGIIFFFASFFGIIIMCDRAIIKQKVRKQHEVENMKG